VDDFSDLKVENEEEEIARLQLPPPVPQDIRDDKERIATIEFKCSGCDMQELVHYFGQKPPFAIGVKFREDTYVMRDPFQAPPQRWKLKPEFYVAIGAHCAMCNKVVCKDTSCSIYYTKTYCLQCGFAKSKSWPVEAQTKLRKQLT
ncbi:CG11755, partial [Drosophila busckii]